MPCLVSQLMVNVLLSYPQGVLGSEWTLGIPGELRGMVG